MPAGWTASSAAAGARAGPGGRPRGALRRTCVQGAFRGGRRARSWGVMIDVVRPAPCGTLRDARLRVDAVVDAVTQMLKRAGRSSAARRGAGPPVAAGPRPDRADPGALATAGSHGGTSPRGTLGAPAAPRRCAAYDLAYHLGDGALRGARPRRAPGRGRRPGRAPARRDGRAAVRGGAPSTMSFGVAATAPRRAVRARRARWRGPRRRSPGGRGRARHAWAAPRPPCARQASCALV